MQGKEEEPEKQQRVEWADDEPWSSSIPFDGGGASYVRRPPMCPSRYIPRPASLGASGLAWVRKTRCSVVQQRNRRRRSSAIARANAQSVVLGKSPEGSVSSTPTNIYNWREFAPTGAIRFLQWLVLGVAKEEPPVSEKDAEESLHQAAVMLKLLQEYERLYGMPEGGDEVEQEWVLQELCRRLCANGVPAWVLDLQMQRAAQGLTGCQGVDFFLRPNTAIVAYPRSTRMFRIERILNFCDLSMLERVLVRLSSFATNTKTAASLSEHGHTIPIRAQLVKELPMPHQTKLHLNSRQEMSLHEHRDHLAKRILDMSSQGYGLFFLSKVEDLIVQEAADKEQEETYISFTEQPSENSHSESLESEMESRPNSTVNPLWRVSPNSREIFARLAAIEAVECLDAIDRFPGQEMLYPRYMTILYRAINTGTSSALWFNGSWQDMIVATFLAAAVSFLFQTNNNLWTNKRMIFEVVVGFAVGLATGVITLTWAEDTCFQAIALAVMIDYLRGFGACFAVMEVISKRTLTGGADLVEAMVFSFLIAANIGFGLRTAEVIVPGGETIEGDADPQSCQKPIDQLWFLLLVPAGAVGWAAAFHPRYQEIPLMAFHAVLAYSTNFAMGYVVPSEDSYLPLFVASFVLSSSAGLHSRFTGKQALGNVFTGLYALVPGIFVVTQIAANVAEDENPAHKEASLFLTELLIRATEIGIGVWMGTLVFAPLYLGATAGQLSKAEADKFKGLAPVLFI